MANKVKVLSNQSLLDLTIQKYGTIEGLFVFAIANDVSITDALITGTELMVPEFAESDFDIKRYYDDNVIRPATGLTAFQYNTLFAEGLFANGLFD